MDQRSYWEERARSIQDPEEVVRGRANRPNPWLEAYHRRRLLRALVRSGYDGLCLDAACGLGVDFPELLTGFRRVVGLDFSIELLRRSRSSGSPEHVFLVGGNLAALPVASGRCDAAVCIGALQCLSDEQAERAFAEFSRVLRPGGLLALHVKNSRPLQALVVTARAAILRKLFRRRPPAPSAAPQVGATAMEDRYRPCQWYLAQARAAGFVVEWEAGRRWFYGGFLERYRMRRVEAVFETVCAVLPPTRWLTRHWGIDHYLVLRRT